MRSLRDYVIESNNIDFKIEEIDESKLSDMMSKVAKNIKGTFFKLKTFVITMVNDLIVRSVSPVNMIIAYAKGVLPKKAVAMSVGGSQKSSFKKLGASGGSGDDIIKLASHTSTLDMWAGKDVNEEMLNHTYDVVNESSNGSLSLAHPDHRVVNVNKKELHEWMQAVMDAPTSIKLLVWGAPGIGKTAVIKEFVKCCEGRKTVVAVELTKMNPDDFTLPYFEKDSDGKILGAADMPKSWLPCYQPVGDSEVDAAANNIANGATSDTDKGDGGIIFMDEISRCSPKVQNVALTLIQDRSIGGYILGDKWGVVGAANRRTDDEVADIQFSKTLGNRFMSVNYVPVLDEWLDWAQKQKYMSKEILAFLKFNEEYWYSMHPDDEDEIVFPTPRSWEHCCLTLATMAKTGKEEGFKLEDLNDRMITMVIGAAVGADVARMFMTYYALTKTVDLDALYNVWDNPKKAPKFSTRMDLNYFMTSRLLSALKTIPTPEQYINFCTWICTSKNASLVMQATNVLWDMYPDVRNLNGDPEMQKIDPDNWDKYVAGVDIILKEFPVLDRDMEEI